MAAPQKLVSTRRWFPAVNQPITALGRAPIEGIFQRFRSADPATLQPMRRGCLRPLARTRSLLLKAAAPRNAAAASRLLLARSACSSSGFVPSFDDMTPAAAQAEQVAVNAAEQQKAAVEQETGAVEAPEEIPDHVHRVFDQIVDVISNRVENADQHVLLRRLAIISENPEQGKATLWRTKTNTRASSAWIYNSLQEVMHGHPERMLDHIPLFVPSKVVKEFAQGMLDAQNLLRRTHENQFKEWDEVYAWAREICQRAPPSSIIKTTEALRALSTGEINLPTFRSRCRTHFGAQPDVLVSILGQLGTRVKDSVMIERVRENTQGIREEIRRILEAMYMKRGVFDAPALAEVQESAQQRRSGVIIGSKTSLVSTFICSGTVDHVNELLNVQDLLDNGVIVPDPVEEVSSTPTATAADATGKKGARGRKPSANKKAAAKTAGGRPTVSFIENMNRRFKEVANAEFKVLLENIPSTLTEDTLKQVLQSCGETESVWILNGASDPKRNVLPSPSKRILPASAAHQGAKHVLHSSQSDSYAFVVMKDAKGYKSITMPEVLIFGMVIQGHACPVRPATGLSSFVLESNGTLTAAQLRLSIQELLGENVEIRCNDPKLRRALYLNLEFPSHEEAWKAFGLLLKATYTTNLPIRPLWVRPAAYQLWSKKMRNAQFEQTMQTGEADENLFDELFDNELDTTPPEDVHLGFDDVLGEYDAADELFPSNEGYDQPRVSST